MRRDVELLLGAALAIGLVVAALWGWRHAGEMAAAMSRPEVAAWAVRCGAVAAGALAQVLMITFVAGRFFRRDVFGDVLRLAAGAVCMVALISAVALGLAGR